MDIDEIYCSTQSQKPVLINESSLKEDLETDNDINSIIGNAEPDELLNNGSLIFPKATVPPMLFKLGSDVMEFITSVVLKHEREMYDMIKKYHPTKLETLMCETNQTIIDIIVLLTNKFYNDLYHDVQNVNKQNEKIKLVYDMCEYSGIKYYCLLDMLIRLTVDSHIDVVREKLSIETEDEHKKTVLNQLNVYYSTVNLLHVLSHDCNTEGHILDVPMLSNNQDAFEIVIDQRIL